MRMQQFKNKAVRTDDELETLEEILNDICDVENTGKGMNAIVDEYVRGAFNRGVRFGLKQGKLEERAKWKATKRFS